MQLFDYFDPLLGLALLFGLLSLYSFLAFVFNFRSLGLFSRLRRLISFLLFAAMSAVFSLILLGIQGYQGLTQETLAATVELEPQADKNVTVRLIFADGRRQIFAIQGDQVLIDAHILKWKPWVTALGMKTAYKLDRISGRYSELVDETSQARTVYSLTPVASSGLAGWRERYKPLSFLLDVEHGSASFADATNPVTYQLKVTSSGLLLRPQETGAH